MKKKIVILSGAGISAESGISTFRDSDGLWENHNVEDVASIDGWYRNPKLIIDFYNERRAQLEHCEPNDAHKLVAKLEEQYDVTVVTQNVDNLHERGGSSKIIHLHGELTKACNERKTEVFDIGYAPMKYGERAKDGSLLRPFIVWFGEAVPKIEDAVEEVMQADICIVICTSLNVYPAAGLVRYVPDDSPIYLIDPADVAWTAMRPYTHIKKGASAGMEELFDKLKVHC
jgi:NAD-dependent deacetylase